MFNASLKKQALKIHEDMVHSYNESYKAMSHVCERLYETRTDSVKTIQMIQAVINSIANTPKEFATTFGQVEKELANFKETERYAQEAYDASVKAGVNIAGGMAAGIGIASMAPTAMMSIATTFGTATTGTAISALSGAAAQKAAYAWLGRTFAGFAVKQGAGMAAGQAFLALAGPIGWGITATSAGVSLISMTGKNKEIADKAIEEAKEIAKAREELDEVTAKVDDLRDRTLLLLNDLNQQKPRILGFTNANYAVLGVDDKKFLGTLVNNTQTLATLLNTAIK